MLRMKRWSHLLLCVGLFGLVVPVQAQEDEAAPKKPASNSPLVVEPETPEELFAAIELMVDIGRPEVARIYLDAFMEGDPDDELLLKLREKHGPAVFLRFSNVKELQPASIELLERNNQAFAKFASDPARLQGFIADLSGPSAERRDIALHQLETAGAIVVPSLLHALGLQANAKHRDIIEFAILRIGKPAVPALIGALHAPDSDLQAVAIDLLGRIGDRRALPYLLYHAAPDSTPDTVQDEALTAVNKILKRPADSIPSGIVARLMEEARMHYQGQFVWPLEADGTVSLWYWDPASEMVIEQRLTPAAASTRVGLEMAQQALSLEPQLREAQLVYLNLLLAAEAGNAKWFDPLAIGPGTAFDLSLSLGPDVVSQVLDEALKRHRTGPAIVALRVLARIGTARQLQSMGDRTSPLIAALSYPDRRVQFAAASTAVALDPTKTFSGADQIIATLVLALTHAEDAMPRALVIDSAEVSGQRMSGFLGELGYNATLTTTGQAGFRWASEGSELDLVLIEANVARWGLSETIANFKADSRTAALPIVIYGADTVQKNLRVILKQYSGVTFVIEPTASQDLESQMADFLKEWNPEPMTPDERSNFATHAADLLAYISHGQRQKLYPLIDVVPQIVVASQNPALTSRLIPVLGGLATREAQQQLAALALDGTVAMEDRAAAASQLALHIERHSLVLTADQVQALKATWQQATEPEFHAALSGVMGALQPDAELVGERLSNFKTNPAPAPQP